MSPGVGRKALVVATLPLLAAPAWAQQATTPLGAAWRTLSDSSRATWVRPAASLVLPGTGQLMGGSERAALYLVAETFLLIRYVSLNHDGSLAATQYRDLAFSVARGAFGPQTRDTVFEYYETMGKYIESGPFDTDSGPGLTPPWDERTFNGRIWLLARQTFFQNPDSIPDASSAAYAEALDFYRRRAVGPNFRWSWRGAALEQDLFRNTIRSSDEAFREARGELGLLLANHLLSAIDALVSSRLGARASRRPVTGGIQLAPGVRRAGMPHVILSVQARF